MTDFSCRPPCAGCRKAGECTNDSPRKVPDMQAEDVDSSDALSAASCTERFYPNREKDIQLRCGCWIPWPIVTLLGTGGGDVEKRDVFCSEHGWQKRITIAQIKAAKKRLRKALAAGATFDDFPPF